MKNFTETSKKNHEKPSCQNALRSKALTAYPGSHCYLAWQERRCKSRNSRNERLYFTIWFANGEESPAVSESAGEQSSPLPKPQPNHHDRNKTPNNSFLR